MMKCLQMGLAFLVFFAALVTPKSIYAEELANEKTTTTTFEKQRVEHSSMFVTGLVSTTLAVQPSGSEIQGIQEDLTIMLGSGYFFTPQLALELDLGPTFLGSEYIGFAVVPGLIWAFHKNIYSAARIVVPVDPEPDGNLFPGLGFIHSFENGMAAYVETNLSVNVGQSAYDLGWTATAGVLYSF